MNPAQFASWDKRFFPSYTPKEMLELGVFEGKYLNAIRHKYPIGWFTNAKLSNRPNPSLNLYGVKSRLSLSHWKEKGWITNHDPLGWFEWYCNYYMGRRCPDDDRQIKRWIGVVARHGAQVTQASKNGRLKQKQALLQWAWNWEDSINSMATKYKNLEHLANS